jgi:peptidyl-prolyl cis-trans isomerase A (cyclophilin A)
MHQAPKTHQIDVLIETPTGPIVVRLEAAKAPKTVANFVEYADRGLFDGGRFHRTVRLDNQSNAGLKVEESDAGIAADAQSAMPDDTIAIEVIQGGINPDRKSELRDPVPLERTSETGLRHLDGTISMARKTPDSAISDFFICINDQPDLNFGGMRNPDGQGFAAFGHVIQGMDVVRAIQTSPSEGQSLMPPVPILTIRRS